MQSDNHNEREMDIDSLAGRIRQEVSKAALYCLEDQAALALIWGDDKTLSDTEKRMHVKNFALQYGFNAVVDFGLSCVVFRDSN